jgi:hypothetical protein
MVGPTAACVLVGMLVSAPAWAEPTTEDKALALKLFDEGKNLLAAGKIDDACCKLEESRRLDPLPGTVLNVAVCHEQQGRAASAVADFREARALAERDGRADRVTLADQHLHALEPQVSSLVIVVPPEADRPDLVITRDATPVGRVAWGTRIPVDPGDHVVEATATNKKAWKSALTVASNGDVKTVTLAPLEDAAPAAPAPAPPPVVQPVKAVPAPSVPPPTTVTNEHRGLSTRRMLALVSGGVGLVGVGLGTYFGLSAISKHHDPSATCMTTSCPTADNLNKQAGTAADVATASFAVGLVGLGLGAFLWLGDTTDRAEKAGIKVTPSLAWGRAGIDLAGRF